MFDFTRRSGGRPELPRIGPGQGDGKGGGPTGCLRALVSGGSLFDVRGPRGGTLP